jgi:hypothetical protein
LPKKTREALGKLPSPYQASPPHFGGRQTNSSSDYQKAILNGQLQKTMNKIQRFSKHIAWRTLFQ